MRRRELKSLVIRLVVLLFIGVVAFNAPIPKAAPQLSSIAEAQTAGTVDVAKCWALVSLTVATVEKFAAIMAKLDALALSVLAADNAASLTISGWLARIGLTSNVGLGKLVVKALELAGLPTASSLTKATMMAVVNAAKSALGSCWMIGQTFWSSGSAIVTAMTMPTACGSSSNHSKWIQCQASCGTSKSAAQQMALWSIPAACNFEPVATNLRSIYINGYAPFCMSRFCMAPAGSSVSAVTSFSQCTLMGGTARFPPGLEPGANRTATCNKLKEAKAVL